MNLYRAEVQTKRRTLEVVVHAYTLEDARAHLASKFKGCEISGWKELDDGVRHFTVAELEEETTSPR